MSSPGVHHFNLFINILFHQINYNLINGCIVLLLCEQFCIRSARAFRGHCQLNRNNSPKKCLYLNLNFRNIFDNFFHQNETNFGFNCSLYLGQNYTQIKIKFFLYTLNITWT